MRSSTPIFLSRILESVGFTTTPDDFGLMALELDRIIDQVTGTDARITVSNSLTHGGLEEHFSEFELKVLNQLTTDAYYEALKTDDRKYINTHLAEELAKPLRALKEKVDEGIDMLNPEDIPF